MVAFRLFWGELRGGSWKNMFIFRAREVGGRAFCGRRFSEGRDIFERRSGKGRDFFGLAGQTKHQPTPTPL